MHEHARALNQAALPPQVDYSAQTRGRNAGSGVSVMQGRGDGLPQPWASRLAPAIIGRGSAQFHGNPPQTITFSAGEDVSAGYASTLFNGGIPMESTLGKPWKNITPLRKFNKNRGISDHPVTEVCAHNWLNDLLRRHAGVTHENPAARDDALRCDMLANAGDEARDVIYSFDENANWEALVVHFLQHCGPPDIFAGVHSMLEDAHSEEVEQTLQQRVQKLTMSWIRAQATYYGVFPEIGARGLRSPARRSIRCSNNTPS